MSQVTVRAVLFGEADPGAAVAATPAWGTVLSGLGGVLATLSPPGQATLVGEVTRAVGGLLNLDVVDVLVGGWRKHRSLRAAAERTKANPGTTEQVELASHRITTTHRPYLDIAVNGAKVATVHFDLGLTLDLEVMVARGVAGPAGDHPGRSMHGHRRDRLRGSADRLASGRARPAPGAATGRGHPAARRGPASGRRSFVTLPHRCSYTGGVTSPDSAIVAPSLLAADFSVEAARLVEGTADWLHVDIMDHVFVPNRTIGLPEVQALRKATTIPFDCHLMIVEPEQWATRYAEAGADTVTFHAEAPSDPVALARDIRAAGARPGSRSTGTPRSSRTWSCCRTSTCCW